MSCDPAGLVDLDRYPLLSPDSPRLQEVIAAAQAQLKSRGAAELTAFLSQLGLAAAVADANALGAIAYRGEGYGTVYLEPGSGELPEDHPRRWVGRAAVSVVAYDQFPPASPLRRLYEWQPLMQFIGDILERGPLYRYADPLGALNLAVMGDGDELQWHFDQTDFVVSLALQDGERGGDFEVVPFLRTADDENYDEVKRVVSGTSDAVVTLPMTP
ncbi:MAG TPA: hypothetical protein VEB21_16145, partial [Terriglobales bacterium]|nr:hypothetical protein [Terriglobales bacterium]